MPAGRPRTVSPSDPELEILGKELVEWAQVETKPPRIRLAQFYSIEKKILRKVWKEIIQIPKFRPYYEEAQTILAGRVLDTDVLDKSYGNRYIRLYDRELVAEEDAQVVHKAKASVEAREQINVNVNLSDVECWNRKQGEKEES